MAMPKRIFSDEEKKLLVALYEIGLDDKQVAAVFKVPRQTLASQIKYNKLDVTIKSAKNCADDKVVASLYNACLRGNTAAMIFWLCNRQPENWKNVNRVDVSGSLTVPKMIIAKPAEMKNVKADEEKYEE